MVAFILGVVVGAFIGLVFMAVMNAASWDDREREFIRMHAKEREGDPNEYELD